MNSLEEYINWVNDENSNRSLQIELAKNKEASIWAYDYNLQAGTHIQLSDDINEVDLNAVREARDLETLEKLAKKLGREIK